MVGARNVFAHRHCFLAPCLLNQAVVTQKLLALQRTGHTDETAMLGRWHKGWAGFEGVGRCQSQAVGQKRGGTHRFKLKQSRNGHRLVHQMFGQGWVVSAPIAGQQHGCQMATSRVTDDRYARWVTTKAMHVAIGPRRGLDHLHHDVRNGHCRTQCVIGHQHTSTLGGKRRHHKGVVDFVKRAPVAAMDEDHHRCASRVCRCSGLCRKNIERFVGAVTIGHILKTPMRFTCVLRGFAPARKVHGMLGHQGTVVVHAVIPFACVVVGHIFFSSLICTLVHV